MPYTVASPSPVPLPTPLVVLIGQEPREVPFLGSESAPTPEGDDQSADGSIAVDQRQRDARVEVVRLGERSMPPARIPLDALDRLALARCEDGARDTRAARDRRGAD